MVERGHKEDRNVEYQEDNECSSPDPCMEAVGDQRGERVAAGKRQPAAVILALFFTTTLFGDPFHLNGFLSTIGCQHCDLPTDRPLAPGRTTPPAYSSTERKTPRSPVPAPKSRAAPAPFAARRGSVRLLDRANETPCAGRKPSSGRPARRRTGWKESA